MQPLLGLGHDTMLANCLVPTLGLVPVWAAQQPRDLPEEHCGTSVRSASAPSSESTYADCWSQATSVCSRLMPKHLLLLFAAGVPLATGATNPATLWCCSAASSACGSSMRPRCHQRARASLQSRFSNGSGTIECKVSHLERDILLRRRHHSFIRLLVFRSADPHNRRCDAANV